MKQTDFMTLQEEGKITGEIFDQAVTDMLTAGWQIFSSGMCDSGHWVHLVKTE